MTDTATARTYGKEVRCTVQRPDGTTEVVVKPLAFADPTIQRKAEQATRQAGKGTILGWEIVREATGPLGAAIEFQIRRAENGLCPRCHTYCDGDCRR